MGLFDFLKKGGRTSKRPESSKSPEPSISCSLGFADSSSISPDERPYYQNDSYYTFYSHPDTPIARKVVTFEERKMTAFPSLNGLYPAEILLLSYCAKGAYPKPKSGYPGLWWFEYGIRDVGHALESLEKRGFVEWAPKSAALKNLKVDELKSILQAAGLPTKGKKADLVARVAENIPEPRITIPDYTPKYRLTSLGESRTINRASVLSARPRRRLPAGSRISYATFQTHLRFTIPTRASFGAYSTVPCLREV